jgi:hypothetical protein
MYIRTRKLSGQRDQCGLISVVFTPSHTANTAVFCPYPQSIQSARLSVQLSELGPPHPLTRKRVLLPPLFPKVGDTFACGGRGWGDPIPRKGQPLWYSMSYTVIPKRSYLSSLYSLLTLYRRCGLAYPYHWRGFVRAKNKTSVGLLVLNSLCH